MGIWDFCIALGLVTAVWLYMFGWWRQPAADVHMLLPNSWRILTFATAVLLLIAALFSPLHSLSTRYFYMHVLQRLLLVSLIPCLFLSGNPLPILQAGLPAFVQDNLRQLPHAAPRFYKILLRVTSPLPTWFLFVATFWLWHDVQIDRLVLQANWVHRFENVTLLGTAVLYWWHILATSPRLHPPLPPLWRVGYTALGAAPVKLVGFVLMFTSTAVYQYPAQIQFANPNITDQSFGAAIVWVVGGIVFTWTAVLLMRDWLKTEDEKPALPESTWGTEAFMLAPGFRKS